MYFIVDIKASAQYVCSRFRFCLCLSPIKYSLCFSWVLFFHEDANHVNQNLKFHENVKTDFEMSKLTLRIANLSTILELAPFPTSCFQPK